jgi:hypothetical protein
MSAAGIFLLIVEFMLTGVGLGMIAKLFLVTRSSERAFLVFLAAFTIPITVYMDFLMLIDVPDVMLCANPFPKTTATVCVASLIIGICFAFRFMRNIRKIRQST